MAGLMVPIWSTNFRYATMIEAVSWFLSRISFVPRYVVTMSTGFCLGQSTSWVCAKMIVAW
jgi:hypothetical protein